MQAAITTAQRYLMYADWVPIVNWYSPIARVPLAVSQLATGAIKDGALNLCRAGLFYELSKARDFGNPYVNGIINWIKFTLGSSLTLGGTIGYDIARCSVTVKQIYSLGVPNPFNALTAMEQLATRWSLIPFASTFISCPVRFVTGVFQGFIGFRLASGAKLGMGVNWLLGENSALKVAKATFQSGMRLSFHGMNNIARAGVEAIPIIGNYVVWGLD